MSKIIINLRLIIISILLFMVVSNNILAQQHENEENFDSNWRFARFGLQPDGSTVEEPSFVYHSSFNDVAWRELDLPHDWGIEGPFRQDLEGLTGKLPWRGIGWYRKYFTVKRDEQGKQFYVDFDGAMANAEIWINGEKVGARPYGYISFRVDLTPHITFDSNNVIAVRLNTEDLGSRWYPGAGIYRHVRFIKTDPIHVAHWGVFVTTPMVTTSKATANVEVKIQNNHLHPKQCKYSVDIYELSSEDKIGRRVASSAKKSIEIEGNSSATINAILEVDAPKLWDIESTNRYISRVNIYCNNKRTDRYDTPFGFRTIEFTHDNGFLLNGKRVQLNGTCNHHDLGPLGTAVNIVALERQLKILKSFGCNALRTSHNPPAPELLTLADKMGFFVVNETFDTWAHTKKENDYSSLFNEWHEKDIESLICRDRNHPSVIMWSTGNEVHEQYYPESGTARHLTEIIHKFDTTRPATFGASYPSRSAMNGTELQVDVHGMNYAAGVYGGPYFYGDFLNKEGHEHLSGYSSESASTISSRGEYYPRDFHVSSYDLREPGWGSLPDDEFAALDRFPAICGEFVWTGFDYLGEPIPFNSDNSILLNHAALTQEELVIQQEKLKEIDKKRPTSRSSYFGIVDLAGFPKDRFYLYQSRWLPNTRMAHILPHWNFPDRVGLATPVFVYTSGDEAELFLNGKSLGRKKKQAYEYRLKWDHVLYEPGELKTIAYKNNEVWAEAEVRTTGEPVKIKLTPDKTIIKADNEDLIFVRISLLDKDGNEVPTAENIIHCNVEGEGQVIATDNGDPTSHIIFSQTSRPAFNGLMLAIVKADKNGTGKLKFKAVSNNIESDEFTINIVNSKKKS